MICNKCGSEIPNGQKFCGNCGTKAPVSPFVPAQQASEKPVFKQQTQKPAFQESVVQPFKSNSQISNDQPIVAGFQKTVHMQQYKQSLSYGALRSKYPSQSSYRPTYNNYGSASESNSAATIGLILSIVAVLLSCLPCFNLLIVIPAIIFTILGVTKENSSKVKFVVSLVLILITFVVSLAVFSASSNSNKKTDTQSSVTYTTVTSGT